MSDKINLFQRLPVVSKGNKGVGLTINRIGGQKPASVLHFTTEQLKRVVNVAGTTLYPAISNIDYIHTDSTVVFKPGQVNDSRVSTNYKVLLHFTLESSI